jgi:coenzyme Q-binding protein COQ10
MPVFQAKQRVHHSADEMFDLVADVERYSAFVPLCERHVIRSRQTCAQAEILMTDMTVAYRFFRETFRSRVTLDRANGRIVVASVDGPLRELETRWTFQARDDGSCDVGFHLSYELASRTLALLMGAVFDAAFSRFAAAFQRRADIVYGRPSLAAAPDRHSPGHRQYDRRKTASLESTMQHGKRRLA